MIIQSLEVALVSCSFGRSFLCHLFNRVLLIFLVPSLHLREPIDFWPIELLCILFLRLKCKVFYV